MSENIGGKGVVCSGKPGIASCKKINRSLTIYLNNNYLYTIYDILIMVFRGSFFNFFFVCFFLTAAPKSGKCKSTGSERKISPRTIGHFSNTANLNVWQFCRGRSICSAAFGVNCSFGAESSFGADCSFVTLQLKAIRKSIAHNALQ